MECRGQDGQSRETFWDRTTVQLETEEDVCAARSENSESSGCKEATVYAEWLCWHVRRKKQSEDKLIWGELKCQAMDIWHSPRGYIFISWNIKSYHAKKKYIYIYILVLKIIGEILNFKKEFQKFLHSWLLKSLYYDNGHFKAPRGIYNTMKNFSNFLLTVDPLEEGMATPCSILAWRIPWTEEPGGLGSIGSQRVGHDWSNLAAAAEELVFRKYRPQESFLEVRSRQTLVIS